ncbi:hypothetical protein SAMN04489740_3839 [Arthrobacter alpinus]|uniref:Lipoprotein n=1 Tax=Arthrobacter alpinus TaxID=656366 RepID=A0A1H5NMF2_9MICC|nr:hypothetical protein [Arthrobacter alpinus]SEF02630.1 hypothetical protein SAMN04489740_3839 [Arthrobacter alpinus]
MNNKKMAAAMLAATMTGALGMSGCATPQAPLSTSPAQSSSSAETSALLLLKDSLRAQLGASYSDSWIEGNKLHVAVTNESAAAIVTKAGAVATLVTVEAAELEEALAAVATWQTKLPSEQARAIHKIIPDGKTGTVTIFVASEQLDAVAQSAAEDKPTGKIALMIKESTGLATPY